MNIETVKNNIKQTISGKKIMLENINFYSGGNKTVEYATAKFLELNLIELENILDDLEKI